MGMHSLFAFAVCCSPSVAVLLLLLLWNSLAACANWLKYVDVLISDAAESVAAVSVGGGGGGSCCLGAIDAIRFC